MVVAAGQKQAADIVTNSERPDVDGSDGFSLAWAPDTRRVHAPSQAISLGERLGTGPGSESHLPVHTGTKTSPFLSNTCLTPLPWGRSGSRCLKV